MHDIHSFISISIIELIGRGKGRGERGSGRMPGEVSRGTDDILIGRGYACADVSSPESLPREDL